MPVSNPYFDLIGHLITSRGKKMAKNV